MKVILEINVNPELVKRDSAIARGVAKRLGETALREVATGKADGTITESNGSATYKVEAPKTEAPKAAK